MLVTAWQSLVEESKDKALVEAPSAWLRHVAAVAGRCKQMESRSRREELLKQSVVAAVGDVRNSMQQLIETASMTNVSFILFYFFNILFLKIFILKKVNNVVNQIGVCS